MGLTYHDKRFGCRRFGLGGRPFGRLCNILSAKPRVMQGSPSAIFRQHETISGSPGTLTGQHRCSQADPEPMGFDLHVTFHQDDLKRPALEPTQSEGIGHEVPFGVVLTRLAADRARDAVGESGRRVRVQADQTRVMKWVSVMLEPCS